MQRYQMIGGPLDGSTLELPSAISVTKLYAHVDPSGQTVEIYHACATECEQSPEGPIWTGHGYKWIGTEKV